MSLLENVGLLEAEVELGESAVSVLSPQALDEARREGRDALDSGPDNQALGQDLDLETRKKIVGIIDKYTDGGTSLGFGREALLNHSARFHEELMKVNGGLESELPKGYALRRALKAQGVQESELKQIEDALFSGVERFTNIGDKNRDLVAERLAKEVGEIEQQGTYRNFNKKDLLAEAKQVAAGITSRIEAWDAYGAERKTLSENMRLNLRAAQAEIREVLVAGKIIHPTEASDIQVGPGQAIDGRVTHQVAIYTAEQRMNLTLTSTGREASEKTLQVESVKLTDQVRAHDPKFISALNGHLNSLFDTRTNPITADRENKLSRIIEVASRQSDGTLEDSGGLETDKKLQQALYAHRDIKEFREHLAEDCPLILKGLSGLQMRDDGRLGVIVNSEAGSVVYEVDLSAERTRNSGKPSIEIAPSDISVISYEMWRKR